MLIAGEHVQLAVHLSAQRGLRQHAFDGKLDRTLGVFLEQLAERNRLQTAHAAGVMVVHLVVELIAGYRDLFRVQHHDMVAHVHVRAVVGLVLALEPQCNSRAQPTQDFATGINDIPVAADSGRLGEFSLHLLDPVIRAPRTVWKKGAGVYPRSGPLTPARSSSAALTSAISSPRGAPPVPPRYTASRRMTRFECLSTCRKALPLT